MVEDQIVDIKNFDSKQIIDLIELIEDYEFHNNQYKRMNEIDPHYGKISNIMAQFKIILELPRAEKQKSSQELSKKVNKWFKEVRDKDDLEKSNLLKKIESHSFYKFLKIGFNDIG